MRINKYLSQKGICTRKEADVLIKEGKVKINNVKAKLGDKVKETDNVLASFKKDLTYFAFYKPKGIITHSPQRGEKEIKDIFPKDVFPVGRLDKDSEGLIILTNDGRVTDRLLNPEFLHEKEYIVKTDRPIDLKRMASGVKLDDGYITRRCMVKSLGRNIFSVVLTEGKKRQIRRMCGALGAGVKSLKRIRIMRIRLGSLRPGGYKEIKGELLKDLGL
ncbi:pseudouridine synthase [Patescibacteria group bacterium]|nr:pseudouridine synthase [Patescibacteria group bacterium]